MPVRAVAELLFWRPVPRSEPSAEALASSLELFALHRQALADAVVAGQLGPAADSDEAAWLISTLVSGVLTQTLANEPDVAWGRGRSPRCSPAPGGAADAVSAAVAPSSVRSRVTEHGASGDPPAVTSFLARAATCAVLAAGLLACGAAPEPPPVVAPPPPPTTPPIVAPVEQPVERPVERAVPAAPAATSWTMPDLVGANLQDAQNAIQRMTDLGIAVTYSHDRSGAGRNQVLDRNWKVCSQNVAPGGTVTAESRIDFGAVKLEENC